MAGDVPSIADLLNHPCGKVEKVHILMCGSYDAVKGTTRTTGCKKVARWAANSYGWRLYSCTKHKPTSGGRDGTIVERLKLEAVYRRE